MNASHTPRSSIFPVAHLVIALDNGGLEHLVTRWTDYRNKQAKGSTHIICLDQNGSLAGEFDEDAIHCISADRSRCPWDRQAVRQLSKLLSDLGIALVHSHNSAAHLYGVLASRKIGIAHLQTQHGMDIHGRGFKGTLRNRILGFFTSQYAAVSTEVARNICKNHGVSPTKVHFVANGVGEHRTATVQVLQQLRDTLKIPKDAFVLGSVGRLATVKGWDLFLPVFAKMVKKTTSEKPLHLLLVGDGPERDRLQRITQDLDIERNVSLAGFQQDCHPYYDLINLFVMPSRSEGLSVSLLEAMQAGCPVAVTSVGEHTKLITVSRGGILLTPEDSKSWLKKLSDFIHNTDKQSKCALRGQAHIQSHYTLENTYKNYEALYQRLID
jgi:glycosyltransferase involved in cell wall biosynthesis